MADPVVLAEVWRGEFVESRHRGHAVVCDAAGMLRAAWGDPDAVILPRSSCKMLQALPLAEDDADLEAVRLALACASHSGSGDHVAPVRRWLAAMDLGEADLRCGPQAPRDAHEMARLVRAGAAPDQTHNNCSGKHAGFLALGRRLGGGPDYVAADHPVQVAVRAAFEEMTGAPSPGYATDGCCAPNFATTLRGLARAMARMADPGGLGAVRAAAVRRLVAAMIAHPVLVAGPRRADTELMCAAAGRAAVKVGAEAVHVAILPQQGVGVAIKIEDGATRASECVVAALLVRLGVLEAGHPAVQRRLAAPIANRRGAIVGAVRPDPQLYAAGRPL